MQAETKGEITEILKLSKPHFDGKKFVYTSPYAVEEEELLLWSLTSLQGPLRDEGYRRYRELFEKCLPEMAEKDSGVEQWHNKGTKKLSFILL